MKTFWTVLIVVCIIAAGAFYLSRTPAGPAGPQPVATAHYLCNGGKTIDASFYRGTTTPPAAPGEPPTPGGSVALTLSDGRSMTLRQTLSADGARYSDGNPNVAGSETFVFWSKGNGALVLENNVQKSYIGCVAVAAEPAGSGLGETYASSTLGFSIRYPAGYTVDQAYRYQELGPGHDINGVKFTIASTTAAGTNLAPDTYLSVEAIPAAQDCTATRFLEGATARTVTEGGTTYSVASTTGAGAGNRYEETVYALPGTNPCLAVRYFIHYGVFENYPAGSVTRFDHTALVDRFDAIRQTLVVDQ